MPSKHVISCFCEKEWVCQSVLTLYVMWNLQLAYAKLKLLFSKKYVCNAVKSWARMWWERVIQNITDTFIFSLHKIWYVCSTQKKIETFWHNSCTWMNHCHWHESACVVSSSRLSSYPCRSYHTQCRTARSWGSQKHSLEVPCGGWSFPSEYYQNWVGLIVEPLVFLDFLLLSWLPGFSPLL